MTLNGSLESQGVTNRIGPEILLPLPIVITGAGCSRVRPQKKLSMIILCCGSRQRQVRRQRSGMARQGRITLRAFIATSWAFLRDTAGHFCRKVSIIDGSGKRGRPALPTSRDSALVTASMACRSSILKLPAVLDVALPDASPDGRQYRKRDF